MQPGGSDVSSGDGAQGSASDAAWRPPAPAASASEHLAGYRDLVEVGRGGDSVVYRARQDSMGRDVAIKVLDIDTAADPGRAARFAREVQLTVDLGRQHPNIVTVLDTGTTASGRPAIVMDFCEGGTLHDRLRAHGPLPPEEVGRIGEVLADALAFAHARGVLHRDVKPQNVLVLPTSWVLTDFGIARLVDAEHTSSAETFTYRHAAPQLLDGLPPTAADDVWSLGSTLYTLLDGRPPFASLDPDEDSALAYLRRARTEPYRPLHVQGAERLAEVVDRCLRKDVAERWGSAAELRDALHALRASAWEPGAAAAAPVTTAGGAAPGAAPGATPGAAPGAAGGSERDGEGGAGTGAGRTPATIPDPPRPAPEPAPLAVSAISHVAHGAHATDGAPTGRTGRPDGLDPFGGASLDAAPTGAPPSSPSVAGPSAPELPDEPAPRRSRLPLLLGVGALVVGLLLGVAGAVLRGRDDGGTLVAPPSPTPTVFDDGTGDGGEQSGGGGGGQGPLGGDFRRRANPDLEPTLTDFAYDGVRLSLAWLDPTEGTGQYFLMFVSPSSPQGRTIVEFPPGTTTDAVEVSLPQERGCYYLLVFQPDSSFGVSLKTRRCGAGPDAF